MIEMNFAETAPAKPITCTPDDLTNDRNYKYPTGLYTLDGGRDDPHNHILYFGRGVWVRNQRACDCAVYRLRYVGPARLDVYVTHPTTT